METALFKLITATPEKNYVFNFRLHLILDPEDFYLDARNFYLKHGQEKKIPELPHHEIEILENIAFFPGAKKMNYCCSKRNEGLFISWADRISSEQEAEDIIETWSVGTTYTMIRGFDFSDLYEQAGNKKEFFQLLKQNFGIYLLEKKRL